MIRKLLLAAILFSAACRPPDESPKTIMAIFAHPDDEIDVSPLLSRLAQEGHRVFLTIATRGDRGVQEHAQIPAGDSLTNVRAREAACACSELGIEPPILLGLDDGKLANNAALEKLRVKLDSVLTFYKPDLVITWGPEGGSGHPDHRMVGAVVSQLYQSGTGVSFPLLMYTGIPTDHWLNTPEYNADESKRYHANYKTLDKKHLTVRIGCDSAYHQKAQASMRCHVSQYPPEELDDNERWMKQMNRDTVYLRPFDSSDKIPDWLY